MSQFEKNEITRSYYLKQMGALCLKASKESDRLVNERVPPPEPSAVPDSDSNDSLSETRMVPHSSDSDSDQYDQPANRRPRTAPLLQKRKQTANKASRPICPVCEKGFQLGRIPPLHLYCSICKKPMHKFCIQRSREGEFIRCKCQDSVDTRKSLSPKLPSHLDLSRSHQYDLSNDEAHRTIVPTGQSSISSHVLAHSPVLLPVSAVDASFSLPIVER